MNGVLIVARTLLVSEDSSFFILKSKIVMDSLADKDSRLQVAAGNAHNLKFRRSNKQQRKEKQGLIEYKMKFVLFAVLALAAAKDVSGRATGLRSANLQQDHVVHQDRLLQDEKYAFLVSGIDPDEAWCITAADGVNDFKNLGFRRCKFDDAPNNQLWRLDSEGKIHSKVDPSRCMVVDYGKDIFDGVRIRIANCDLNTDLNRFSHNGATDMLRVVEDQSFCVTNRGTGPDPSDTIHAKPCGDMSRFAFTYRNEDGTTPPTDDPGPMLRDDFAICVVDDRGFPLAEEDPGYDTGDEVVSSELTLQEANNEISNGLGAAAKVSGVLGNIAGNIPVPWVAAIGKGLEILSGALKFLSSFASKYEVNPEQQFLLNQFRITNFKIDQLSDQVEAGFNVIRKEASDNVLDGVMNHLSRMTYSYVDLVESLELDKSIPTYNALKRHYVDEFRRACNDGPYRAEDIARILYGYACGDEFSIRKCSAKEGSDTGECKYGIKARNYLFDVYRDIADGDLTRFNSFGVWLVGAMSQALFFQAVCLPSDPAICPSESDPVFEEKKLISAAAFDEVITNLEWVSSCACPCKRVEVIQIDTDVDGVGDEVELKLDIQGKRVFTGDLKEDSLVDVDFGPENIFSLTKGESIRVRIEEDDDPLPNDIVEGEWDWTFKEGEGDIPGWFSNTCDTYTRGYKFMNDENDVWTLNFRFVADADGCPESFCSEEKPTCVDPTKYCNFGAFTCEPKFAAGESCEGNYQCLSGECDLGVCAMHTSDEPCGCKLVELFQIETDSDPIGDEVEVLIDIQDKRIFDGSLPASSLVPLSLGEANKFHVLEGEAIGIRVEEQDELTPNDVVTGAWGSAGVDGWFSPSCEPYVLSTEVTNNTGDRWKLYFRFVTDENGCSNASP